MCLVFGTHKGDIYAVKDFSEEKGLEVIKLYCAEFLEKDVKTLALASSGDFIIFSLKEKNKNHNINSIGIIDLRRGNISVSPVNLCFSISSIVPVYPGRFYVSSGKTNSLVSFKFDIHTLEITEEKIHFDLGDETISHTYFSSVYNFRGRWFGSVFDTKHHRNGCIIELSNQRIIYSGLSRPCNITFNLEERLCFVDYGQKTIVFGDDIFYFDELPFAFTEDNLGNLFISLVSDGNFLEKKEIAYFDIKKQRITQRFDVSEYGKVNTMIFLDENKRRLITCDHLKK